MPDSLQQQLYNKTNISFQFKKEGRYMKMKNFHKLAASSVTFLSLIICAPVNAQLAECAQVDQGGNISASAVGGCIAKTLQEQIGTGHGDEFQFGSAVYLIKRDPARSIRRGRQLFQRKFSAAEGQGPRVNHTSTGDITHSRALGAGLSDSCASCHGRPRGTAGHGGVVQTRPDSRDAPHLFGLGLVEQLADEMTHDLREIRKQVVEIATQTGTSTTRQLITKGINFGSITADSAGNVDTSQVEGVNENLRVLPFFHQGGTASIREFIIGALNDEMGLQAVDPVLCAVTDLADPKKKNSPAGFVYDPELDNFERPKACDVTADPDNDNVSNEIDAAVVDHMEFYLLNYFKPGQYYVSNKANKGRKLMDDIGCTSCHTADLVIENDRRVADVETVYDPVKGIFNQLYATATTLTTDVDDGDNYPLAVPNEAPFVVKNFFSDLKRHDLGPKFHEREWDGTVVTEFVTEPLWGVGTTAPYGHDGRSINLDSVIRRHGGEAQAVTDAYVALSKSQQGSIIEFLQTLVLFPPDDTASNLNPGNPGTSFPQDPSEHGSINLGVLFRIDAEGAE